MTAKARCIPCFPGDIAESEGLAALAAAAGFTAEVGTCLLTAADLPTLLVGCGNPENLTEAILRNAFAAAGRGIGPLEDVEIDVTSIGPAILPADARDREVAQGLLLGSYRFDKHQQSPARRPHWRPRVNSGAWDEGVRLATAVNAVRDVVNEPANVINPGSLADYLVKLGEASGLRVVVRDEEWLEREGAGGILAIGRGSAERPKMVEIIHEGSGGDVDLCLVGKGVTFDAGGLSLKNETAIMLMQSDMAAVPTIAHAMAFLSAVAPSLHVRAFCPLVENMPGPYSTRPGDIVTARNGKSIEVLNTDFEGRVILADGLAFAAEHHPRHIVDVATLTYGAPNALGTRMAALFGQGAAPELIERAAETSAEAVWKLPMPEYLMPTIRSRVADLKNFPYETKARASTAAMFLREFVPAGGSWAHVDIAGPAWTDTEYDANPIGATGYGVRLLLELFGVLRDADRATS
ncbi:leucyl aminopeptidase family protein [Amycolatopsis sp. GM8]|uniref:M17 family metallopeptidase n=1 Tax=Amycolatopsis sp. GM8 TaxID=2896530 RepID=UPI001F3FCDF4|nr:leucyl aminopeptidase family protein [Amycolatopsis sp. GM8]